MSETVTMTLADFLLDRIAEREKRARDVHEDRCGTPAVLMGTDTMGRPYEMPCGCDEHVGRVLAECEAKRRIVELRETAAYQERKMADAAPEFRAVFVGSLSAYDAVLRSLALPYTDHPDYREEWRP